MGDFQTATNSFLTWFKSAGGEFRDDLLEIKDLRARDAGRGIVAIKDIPQETTLFTIPREAIISTETSKLAERLPEAFDAPADDEDDDSEPLDSWGSLILVMLYEYLQGESSKWKPYFDVLPQAFDTPIFWSEAELGELQGTCLTPEKIGKQQSDEMLRTRIVPIVLTNPTIFYPEGVAPLSEDDLLVVAHRMGSTIMAYAFDLDNGNEQSDDEEDGWVEDREGRTMLGMVPMADILNANADFNAHINHGDKLEVTSLRSDLKTGTEILNYYGPLPSSELLRRYGYVTPAHRVYDVVELSWNSVLSALADELNLPAEVLGEVETEFDEEELEEYFIIERDSGEPDGEGRLTYTAELREISPELEEQLKTFLKALKKARPDSFADKRKRGEICIAAITQALTAKLEQYPTSAQEDEALLKKGDLSKRHRMAIEVRLGEKKLLQEGVALMQQTASEDEAATEEGSTKRAKTKA
ncbi:SET domain-containing protein RMS1 [Ophiobolus disseminans]|uniref:SET domain-containing protein RMS1 n=1 Tax=Ophiobolus disseminans TaxID=1469910 RepID=A0A6A6ZQ15_9PLEO|nr:SET domain-containing protein RMS1 [Ophiobolus disseminans]